MQEPIVNRFIAAASEISSSDLYMTVKATMFTTPSPNLNGVRCTLAFMDEIAKNQDKYIGLPLCADMTKLENGLYKNLGHCYNSRTGTFSSTMIGSFYKFEETEIKEGETALIGYARVLKRNKKVCKAISELFAEGNLKFSFEITCGEYEKMTDGTILIDASERNYLEGMAIVSMPACPDAVALELVAEITGIGKEAEPMNEDKTNAAEVAEKYVTQTHVEHDRVTTYDTETGVDTETTVTVEQRVSGPAVTAEDETAEQAAAITAAKDEEDNKPVFNPDEVDTTAPVVETQQQNNNAQPENNNAQPENNDAQPENNNAQTENTNTQTNNDNPGDNTEQPVTGACKKEKENAASDDEKKNPFENEEDESDDSEEEDDEKKKNAELDAVIAELKEFVAAVKAQNEELKQEIAEIKEHMTGKVVAEANAEVNPFMDNISLAQSGYRLLQDEKKQASSYRLLD